MEQSTDLKSSRRSRVVIIQRVVPHYRMALFSRLYEELGWIVATGGKDQAHGLKLLDQDPPWLRRFVFGRDPKNQYKARIPLNEIVNAFDPDGIIAEFSPQMSSTWKLSFDSLTRRSGRPKLIYWSQGPNLERGFVKPGDIASQILRILLMSAADGHLCYSDFGAAYLNRWLIKKSPVFVAKNTTDLDAYPDRYLDTEPSDPAAANLLFIGRITRDKRVPMLIDVVRAARQAIPKLTLTIIGDGPDMPAVRKAAATLGDTVQLVGPIYSDIILAKYFQAASLLVYSGSIGLAANHALAYGVPVAIFDSPGAGARHHPEHSYIIDGVTGFRINPATTQAMIQRLTDLFGGIETPKSNLARSIRQYTEENLSIDNMMVGFRELDRFLGEKRL